MDASFNLDSQFKTADENEALNSDDTSFGNVVGLPELHESRDPEPNNRNRRYNLRKSLAWDSAFFTSAGVLDPEELSTMITGTDEPEKNLLPRIEEDISASTDSLSTFHSDNLMESQEDDLFVDIRASIQRSSKKPSVFTNSSCQKLVDNQAISDLEKEELVHPPCKDPKLSLKKTSGFQAVRTLRGQPKQNTGEPGSRLPLKQDSVQSQNTQVKSIAKMGPSTSFLRKPPTAIATTIPNSTSTVKRETMGAVAKSGYGSLKPAMASRKGTQPPKAPVATSAGRVFPKPVVSLKSSLATSSSMVHSSKLSTSSDSSSSISSNSKAAAKSPIVIAKRNLLRTSNVVTGSVAKSLSRAPVKIKPASSSKNSASTKSTKTPTSVSPASSISEWSSVSSSSSRVNARTSIDACSRKSTDSDVTVPGRKNQSANQIVDGPKNKEIALPVNNLKKASTGSLQAPARPSGLRLPSPKIGFFDGANARTPNKPPVSQSGSRGVLSRSESAASTPKRSSNIKPKISNVPTAAKVTNVVNTNSATSKGTSFDSSKEKALASGNDVLVLMDKDDTLTSPIETKDKARGHKEDEVGAANRVIDVVTSAIDKSLGDLKKEILNEKSNASENGAVVIMDIVDAHSLSIESKDDTAGQHYHKADEVEFAAGNQVIDTVMSAINKNLGELKKEMEQENKEFGVVNFDQGGSGDVMISHNNLENSFDQFSSDKENGNVMIHQGERVKVQDRNVNISASGPMNEVLSEILDCAVSFPAKAFTSLPIKSPFAQNFLVTDDECTSISKLTETKVTDKRVSGAFRWKE